MSKKERLTKRILLSLMAGMTSFLPSAFALPDQGAYDNNAYASIVVNGNVMNITGNYGNNIINWRTFSVASGETVKFMDKNNYLNLVNGFDISRINGTISGGGIVYLINPYGILFGSGATLDNVGSFVASTRDISDVNQEAFLTNPSNVPNVLYTNNHASRNKDYMPDNSPFVPTISVAELNLTNVPASATEIVLDSPGGIVLKDTATLDKTKFVSTYKQGGEIGIGTADGTIALTEAQKKKIFVIDGNHWNNCADINNTDVVKPYKQIHNINELQNINQEAINNFDNPKRYLLANDIDASGFDFKPLGSNNLIYKSFNNLSYTEKGFYGSFDGLGYKIANLKTKQGLFTSFSGYMRNLSLENVSIDNDMNSMGMSGGAAGYFNGSMSNVHCTGHIDGTGDVGGLVGFTFVDGANGLPNDIRNSSNGAEIHSTRSSGGIAGLGSMTYIINSRNEGNIEPEFRQSWLNNSAPQYAGGIVGFMHDDYNKGVYILATYNIGTVTGAYNVGGIGGFLYVPVGDSYNFGKIVTKNSAYSDYYPDDPQKIGGISGLKPYAYTSKITNEPLKSYYVRNFENTRRIQELKFGEELSAEALQAKFDENQKNRIATVGVTTPIIPNYPSHPNTSSNQDSSINSPVLRDAEYNNALTAIDEKHNNALELYNNNINGTLNRESFDTPLPTETSTESERTFYLTPGYRHWGYNVNGGGMYVYDLKVDSNTDAETPISFNLYNTKNAIGVIEYYNEQGEFISADRIEPHSVVIKDLEDLGEQTVNLIFKNLGNGSNITSAYDSTYKKIEAPKGTHKIIVTNNRSVSRYAYASNLVDAIFASVDIGKSIAGLLKGYTKFSEYGTAENLLFVTVREKAIKEIMNSMIEKSVDSGLKKLTKEETEELVLHSIQNFDLGKILADTFVENADKIVVGMTESAAKKFVKEAIGSNPALLSYDLMKLVGNGIDVSHNVLTDIRLQNVRPMVFQLGQ